jgi:murein DD-endopeptidase MepM/ murein hydrolase activator NlpD
MPIFPRRKINLSKLSTRYRLVILSDDSFEEKASLSLTRINVIATLSAVFIVTAILVYAFIVFTPLRAYLPGFSEIRTQEHVLELLEETDSLHRKTDRYEAYLRNIRSIMAGEGGTYADSLRRHDSLPQATEVRPVDSTRLFSRSAADSALRAQIEKTERTYAPRGTSREMDMAQRQMPVEAYHFYPPVSKGLLSQRYDLASGHPAIDVAGPRGYTVHACLDGMVVFAEWSASTGYVAVVQHANDLLSIYKHNARLMAQAGDFVESGEAIAMLGNSGAFSTGPHLHFELWYRGMPLDPEKYIAF